VLGCLGRKECAQVFRKRRVCSGVMKRDEVILFLIELHVSYLVTSVVKWIA